MIEKHHVSYHSGNSYETLNQAGEKTRNIWIVFHGFGYLSRYFLKHFSELPAEENYIIAPQAPAKFYLDEKYSRVGASWLTKEDTEVEIDNVLAYLDAVWQAEGNGKGRNIYILGYSQGVSIAARWVARRKISCRKLIFYSGGIPNELEEKDFEFLLNETDVFMIHGDQDPYLNSLRLEKEEKKFAALFKNKGKRIVFSGGHELLPSVLEQIVNNQQ